MSSEALPRKRTLHTPAWIWVTAILAFEYVGMSLAFDANVITRHLSSAFSLGMLGPLILTIATATVGMRGVQLRNEVSSVLVQDVSLRQAAPLVFVHIMSLAAFMWIPHSLSAQEAAAIAHPGMWIAAWAVLGLVSTVALATIAIPFFVWRFAFQRVAASLAIGLGVGLIAWYSGVASSRLWDPLGDITLHTVAFLLALFEPEIVIDPVHRAIGTPSFYVLIARQCSGYEGIGMMAAYMSCYAIIARKRLKFPNVLALIPLGIVLVWTANAARITALLLLGTHVSETVSFEAFHSKLGWIFFCAIAFGLGLVAERSPRFNKEVVDRTSESRPNPVKRFLAPLLALVAFQLVSGLFAWEINPLYPAAAIASFCVFLKCRPAFGSLAPTPSWEASAIGVLVFLIWIGMEPGMAPAAPPEQLAGWSAVMAFSWIASRVLGSVVVVPIVEEIAFRGYLMRRLIRFDFENVSYKHFTLVSLVGSSAMFGLLHSRVMAGAIAGGLFGLAQLRHGRLGDAVWAHAIANALIAVAVLGGGYWGLWY